MTVFFASESIEPKGIVACPVCGFEFCFNHSEGWSEEGYRFVCYRCRVEQAERERDEARREVEALRAEVERLKTVLRAINGGALAERGGESG